MEFSIIIKALFLYFVASQPRKYRNLGIFELSVRLLLKIEFEKSTTTSCNKVISLLTKSDNLLENSLYLFFMTPFKTNATFAGRSARRLMK